MTDAKNFPIEYSFIPSAEAEEQLAEAYQIICDLILADIAHEIADDKQGKA